MCLDHALFSNRITNTKIHNGQVEFISWYWKKTSGLRLTDTFVLFVRELVTNFIENSDDVTTQSQSSYRTTSVSESDDENEEDEDDEDDIESGNNKSEFSNEKTSTLYIRHV